MIPVAEGGSNDDHNLITSCFDCNRGKGAKGLDCVPESVRERTERLRELEDQIIELDKLLKARRRRENHFIREVEEVFEIYWPDRSFSPAFKESVRHFLQRLPKESVISAMYRACSKISSCDSALRYFCGICWKTIKDGSDG